MRNSYEEASGMQSEFISCSSTLSEHIDERIPELLGEFIRNDQLSPLEQQLVEKAWQAAEWAFCLQADFQVGAAVRALNEAGDEAQFVGCNIMNDSMPAVTCAERTAVFTAVAAGYRHLTHVAFVCRKQPGGSPCGLCRQVLRQFGRGAVVLNICDHDKNVRRARVDDLLPQPQAEPEAYSDLNIEEKELVDHALSLRERAYVPYSQDSRGASVLATNDEGDARLFVGTQIENASFGGSMSAERAAMSAAITSHYRGLKILAVSGDKSLDGGDLQVLRELGGIHAQVLTIRADKSVVRATVEELLPDSFGPESV